MNVLLLSRDNITSYETTFQNGDHGGSNFTNNFAIDTSLFGSVQAGTHCIMGLKTLNLYFFRGADQPKSSSFLYTWSGDQVNGIPYINAFQLQLDTACYGGGVVGSSMSTDNGGSSKSIGAVIGGTIGAITFIGIGLLIFCCCCRHNEASHSESMPSSHGLQVAQ